MNVRVFFERNTLSQSPSLVLYGLMHMLDHSSTIRLPYRVRIAKSASEKERFISLAIGLAFFKNLSNVLALRCQLRNLNNI